MTKYSRTIPCREGLFYLALVVFVFWVAMVKEMNLLVLMAGMLLGPLFVNWRSGRAALKGLEVRRRIPHGVCAGDTLVVSIDVASKRKFSGSWGVAVDDQIRREAEEGQNVLRPGVLFSYVGARQSGTQVYRGCLTRRGTYRFGPLTVSTRFPFGLLRRIRTIAAADTLLVYPRLGRLTQAWNMWRQEAVESARRREQQCGRASGDFFGVREWHQGDSRRWIHWRSSARHGILVVRQFERCRSRQFAVLLDLWQPEQPSPEEVENVELAVSLAATLTATVCRQETNHLLLGLTDGEPECIRGPGSASLREEAMQRLALVEGSHEDRLASLLARALDRIEPGAQVVLVSTRANDLQNAQRFRAVWSDSHRRMLVRQIRQVNTADPRLSEYFQVE